MIHLKKANGNALCLSREGFRTRDPWIINCPKCIKKIPKPVGVAQ